MLATAVLWEQLHKQLHFVFLISVFIREKKSREK
uniref:Uncharacterized protein n=1 Tax=Anguilla anguilla TaxID=7936 RepID=A0A0E9XAI4_ANGAN